MVELRLREEYIELNGSKIFVDEELRKPLLDGNNGVALTPPEGEDRIDIGNAALREYPSLSQFCAMQGMPGLIAAVGLPDIHEGYAFPIGSVAAVDLGRQDASISPEGVGFDINCGVRCLISNLEYGDIADVLDQLADDLFAAVPAGTGEGQAEPPISMGMLNAILDGGLSSIKDGVLQLNQQDILNTESRGSLPGCSGIVYQQAKARGLKQIGTLGSGNHYLEIQVVDEILDEEAACVLGLSVGQVLVSIHTGSRGLGHLVCTKFLGEVGKEKKNVMKYGKFRDAKCASKDGVNDPGGSYGSEEEPAGMPERGIPCSLHVPYYSKLGRKYLSLMNSASNYAWANRALIAQRARGVFARLLPACRLELLYDVCHNIAKVEQYEMEGGSREILVHRKGASRALPPKHPDLPLKYRSLGQPVLVGGSMGTCSYILLGAEGAARTFYSTCHGAGRLLQRSIARETLTYEAVASDLGLKGIVFRCGSRAGVVEEAGDCYKDVTRVVEHSNRMGATKTVARVKPVVVIKG